LVPRWRCFSPSSAPLQLLFNITCFIYIGSIIPFDRFNDHELTLVWWKLVLLVIAVVVLRRLPVMMALWKWIPDIRTYREALFVGHFGPVSLHLVIGSCPRT
jgi:NhaP-type Na+/H+ or K+/H+ antiporter